MKQIIIWSGLLSFIAFSHCFADGGIAGPSLNIQGGFSQLSSDLSGAGFSGDLSGANGSIYGVGLGYAWVTGPQIHLKFSRAEAEFDAPSSITPRAIKASRSEYSLYGLFKPFDDESRWSGLRVGFGYTYLNYQADNNTPAILTAQQSQGLSLMVEDDLNLSEKLFLTTKVLFYLPHKFSEKNANTGFNPSFFGVEGSLQINWNIREDISFYLAGIYRLDKVDFDGAGDRGTTDATDTRTMISVPVGLNFNF